MPPRARTATPMQPLPATRDDFEFNESDETLSPQHAGGASPATVKPRRVFSPPPSARPPQPQSQPPHSPLRVLRSQARAAEETPATLATALRRVEQLEKRVSRMDGLAAKLAQLEASVRSLAQSVARVAEERAPSWRVRKQSAVSLTEEEL